MSSATSTPASTSAPVTGADPSAATPVVQSAGTPVDDTDTTNPVVELEEPFFIVSSKATDGTYDDLDAATTAADEMATLHPGVEIYVLEARRSALSPKPDVETKEIAQK